MSGGVRPFFQHLLVHFDVVFPKGRKAGLKFCEVGMEVQKLCVTWAIEFGFLVPCFAWL